MANNKKRDFHGAKYSSSMIPGNFTHGKLYGNQKIHGKQTKKDKQKKEIFMELKTLAV